ncbi:MAG TPA: polysaccharide deacetylase family protein [Pseudonocardiaceae bacterium]|nr:polysaccharide deacetylase family protein [Pseudonocardiaceae bacterium]
MKPKHAFVVVLLGLVLPLVAGEAAGAALLPAKTQISLTFDDGNADQMTALPVLQKHNMHGTFYIISGSIGAPNYLTLANLGTINGQGNEIAGHTVSHPDLTTVPADEATRQICNGRAQLAAWGYPTTDFAYPYAALNPSVESIVAQCGFNSARGLGDIQSAHGCSGCDTAETTPPRDPYDLEALDEIDTSWTLAQMEQVVTTAQRNSGGWLIYTFHHICAGSGCDSLSISPTMLDQFLTWVQGQAGRGVSVKTVHQVVGGTVKPVVTAPPSTNTTLPNPSLEASTTGDGFPDCFMPGGWGTNTPTWTRTTDAHSGTYAEQLTVTGYSSGDAKLLPTFDLGACTPAVVAGDGYTISVWYKSTAITQFALYTRTANGFWSYWTSGPWLAPSATWTQATFATPAAPAGAVGVSFGLALIANGTVTTDDYAISGPGIAGSSATAMLPRATPLVGSRTATTGSTSIGSAVAAKPWGKHALPSVPSTPGKVIAAPALDD